MHNNENDNNGLDLFDSSESNDSAVTNLFDDIDSEYNSENTNNEKIKVSLDKVEDNVENNSNIETNFSEFSQDTLDC